MLFNKGRVIKKKKSGSVCSILIIRLLISLIAAALFLFVFVTDL